MIAICLLVLTLLAVGGAAYAISVWSRNAAIRQWARATEHLDDESET